MKMLWIAAILAMSMGLTACKSETSCSRVADAEVELTNKSCSYDNAVPKEQAPILEQLCDERYDVASDEDKAAFDEAVNAYETCAKDLAECTNDQAAWDTAAAGCGDDAPLPPAIPAPAEENAAE